jgi:hypothetical protein
MKKGENASDTSIFPATDISIFQKTAFLPVKQFEQYSEERLLDCKIRQYSQYQQFSLGERLTRRKY